MHEAALCRDLAFRWPALIFLAEEKGDLEGNTTSCHNGYQWYPEPSLQRHWCPWPGDNTVRIGVLYSEQLSFANTTKTRTTTDHGEAIQTLAPILWACPPYLGYALASIRTRGDLPR